MTRPGHVGTLACVLLPRGGPHRAPVPVSTSIPASRDSLPGPRVGRPDIGRPLGRSRQTMLHRSPGSPPIAPLGGRASMSLPPGRAASAMQRIWIQERGEIAQVAGGHHVVRPGRAGGRGNGQAQDLDEHGALGADGAAAGSAGLVERRTVAAALHDLGIDHDHRGGGLALMEHPHDGRQARHRRGPHPVRAPAAPLRPDRRPGPVALRQVPPPAAGPADEEHRVDHLAPGDDRRGAAACGVPNIRRTRALDRRCPRWRATPAYAGGRASSPGTALWPAASAIMATVLAVPAPALTPPRPPS